MASSSNAPAITATLVGSNQPIIVDRYNRNRRGHERRLNDLESLGYTIPPTNPYEEGEGNLEGPEWIPIESRVAPFHIFRGDIVACATHAPLVPNMPDVSRLERAFSHANLHRVRMRDSLELRGDKVLYDLIIQVLDHHYEPVLGRRLSPFVLNHLLIVLLCNAAMSVYVQLLGLLDLVPGLTALQRASTDSGFMGGVFEIWIVVNLPPMPPFDHNAHWVFRAVTWDAPIKHEDKGIVMFWTNWDNTRTGFDWRLDGFGVSISDSFRHQSVEQRMRGKRPTGAGLWSKELKWPSLPPAGYFSAQNQAALSAADTTLTASRSVIAKYRYRRALGTRDRARIMTDEDEEVDIDVGL